MSSFEKITQHYQQISHFSHAQAMLGWDAAANMPAGGNHARSGAMAELARHIHQLSTAPQLETWFTDAESESLTDEQQAILRECRRQWQFATIIPEDLVRAKSLAGSTCEHAWRTQRHNNDWQGFEKNWKTVVELSREEAQIRAEANQCSPYDAMLQLYEPGASTAALDTLFGETKQWLPDLINQVIEQQQGESVLTPAGPFPASQQKQLGVEVMKRLRFNFDHGRLDESVHPFCGGVPTDVRITTRYDESDFTQALMGIIHETGHARYEQGLPEKLAGLPAGEARSMGIHESQSLFFEMQLGRHPAFIQSISSLAAEMLESQGNPAFSEDNLQKLYTRVNKGFIRVDADELTYPAHVILRYEIERDLMNGTISHTDVPELWDQKMQSYLGLSTRNNFKDGCMQDIHWTDGSFGYFPSYTLGAMYAAQFMAAMKKTVDVEGALKKGELTPVFEWLKAHIWSKGSLFTTGELVSQATGETLNAVHFKNHLKDRYLNQ
ncbi:Putative metalloprotease YpwA [Vibrio aerogenes CECT 7868]|uniref:Metal-dependent carboxypeptidase n=1 Tax=Vibrio aerogenes CECT 7868 TaxID=1216006 RepID=A0A1M5Z7C8_9VIBR|nr:carboxypeptidase M32 [Vibrio aerogenes]SHI20157.1 Putative metalloprotease YpwA [Vibrio aerogenes CECT 7868]